MIPGFGKSGISRIADLSCSMLIRLIFQEPESSAVNVKEKAEVRKKKAEVRKSGATFGSRCATVPVSMRMFAKLHDPRRQH
jgi:hypothetical protein